MKHTFRLFPTVDQVTIDERADRLPSASIKSAAKLAGLKMVYQ